jgi:hypothetical protein
MDQGGCAAGTVALAGLSSVRLKDGGRGNSYPPGQPKTVVNKWKQ